MTGWLIQVHFAQLIVALFHDSPPAINKLRVLSTLTSGPSPSTIVVSGSELVGSAAIDVIAVSKSVARLLLRRAVV